MADHFNTIVMPACVRSPKDKASVEGSVGVISTWIIAALRNTYCFSIEEMNEELWKKLEEFNHRPFTRKKGCRFSAFEEERSLRFPLFRTRRIRYLSGERRKYVPITIYPLKACFILFHTNTSIDKWM